MKKHAILTITLFFLSVIANGIYRYFPSDEMIHPFIMNKEIPISVAWFAKHLSELSSYSILMFCFCFVLRAAELMLEKIEGKGYMALFVFVKMWHRILWVVAVTSVLDIVHYAISFRQFQLFFLLQSTLFFIATLYFIFKAYYKR